LLGISDSEQQFQRTFFLEKYLSNSPFAPSISHFLNFKLLVERSTEP
jgi:hypothetical protein